MGGCQDPGAYITMVCYKMGGCQDPGAYITMLWYKMGGWQDPGAYITMLWYKMGGWQDPGAYITMLWYKMGGWQDPGAYITMLWYKMDGCQDSGAYIKMLWYKMGGCQDPGAYITMLQCCDIGWVAVKIPVLTLQINVNLALNGTASQETTYTDSNGNSYSANLAIEGPANNNWEDGCSSTAAGQVTQWWGISFPKFVYITNITYYLRSDVAERMNGFRLYFANDTVYKKSELCFGDYANQAFQNLIHSVDCDLSPTKNVYFFNRNTFVELCYIEINGKNLYK
ncbi:unnamed protein product [Mytilus edulis]|uniref:Fucolectin tachylectin-4 pentraxin-1 domain-containing protein n=1 Tax=Mytilus edulis TaxID=6550 RepID=A0A8S3T995_MYTED|nr:unnamed protein product [Mytilus edulis]